MTTNKSITTLFCIFDNAAKEYGQITETRNYSTAKRYFDSFIRDTKLNPEEFELIICGEVNRITILDDKDKIVETNLKINIKEYQ